MSFIITYANFYLHINIVSSQRRLDWFGELLKGKQQEDTGGRGEKNGEIGDGLAQPLASLRPLSHLGSSGDAQNSLKTMSLAVLQPYSGIPHTYLFAQLWPGYCPSIFVIASICLPQHIWFIQGQGTSRSLYVMLPL